MVRMLWVVLVLVVSGCAHDPIKEAQLKSALGAWVGKDINRAFEAMGPPTSEFRMPDGRTMYTWFYQRRNPGGVYDVMNRQSAYECKTRFTVNPDGVIESIRSEGGACRVARVASN